MLGEGIVCMRGRLEQNQGRMNLSVRRGHGEREMAQPLASAASGIQFAGARELLSAVPTQGLRLRPQGGLGQHV